VRQHVATEEAVTRMVVGLVEGAIGGPVGRLGPEGSGSFLVLLGVSDGDEVVLLVEPSA
jgi:hypothetical protein